MKSACKLLLFHTTQTTNEARGHSNQDQNHTALSDAKPSLIDISLQMSEHKSMFKGLGV